MTTMRAARFKAPNYSRSCLLAKAFGVSAANSGERTACPPWWADSGFNARKEILIFFEMSGSKILRKGEVNRINLHTDMNLVAEDRISETHNFTNQFALFPTCSGCENLVEKPASRLMQEQLDAFSNAESDNARSPHFFVPPPEPPAETPEKGLAAGVLKQAACDLRRFRSATTGVRRELYLDAYTWITATDFSWPYSFVNVCNLLDVCPEVVRAELFADASLGWFDYWTNRAGRLSRKLQSSFVRVFAGRNLEGTAASQLA
jgi:hypothetical protein